ncbi:MAG: FAD-binding protein [Polyangiales bacterium]
MRWRWLGCGLLLACGTESEPAPDAGSSLDARVVEVDGYVALPSPARDAASSDAHSPRPDPSDPTGPTAITGMRALTPAYDTDLAALVAFKRTSLWNCPGLLEAASCGDGHCDAWSENATNCRADCVPHLVGAYNDLPICPDYQRLVQPHSVDEVQEAVRQAAAMGQHVHPIGRRHSASDALCGDGLALDLSSMADVEATRVEGDVAYVQPGVTMIALGDWLEARQLGIGYTHLGFRGVTVAGAIGTSAHGSSPFHNNAIAQRLVSLKMVLANGELRTFTSSDEEWRAVITSLGLLGVVVEVGVRVEPALRLAVEFSTLDEKQLLDAASPLDLLAGCEWGQFNWFPKHRKVFRWCGKPSTQPADGHPDNVLLDPGVSPDIAPLAKIAFHAGTCGDALNELVESARVDGLTSAPPIKIDAPDGGRINVAKAVGPGHRLTSADLIELGEHKYFQMDWEVAVPQQYMRDALQAARKIFDAHNVSLPGVGAFLRFGKIERGGWLSYHGAGKQFAEGQTAMFFETPVAVPAGYSDSELRDYLYVYQTMIELFVRHYGARAHWGKNLDGIFTLQQQVGTYEGRLERFNAAVAKLDPKGVFANAFAQRIGVRWP